LKNPDKEFLVKIFHNFLTGIEVMKSQRLSKDIANKI